MPRARSLRVAGIFQLGLYEFDSAYAVVSLPVGLRLMGKPYPDFLQLKVDDIYQAHAVAEAIVARYGATYQVQDWAQMNQSLFSALQLEKMAVSITIGLIVMRRRAEHRRLARADGDGEEPRHRHPEDDGRDAAQHLDRVHAAGHADRRGRHGGRPRARPRPVVRPRSLPAGAHSRRRLPDRLRAVPDRAAGASPWSRARRWSSASSRRSTRRARRRASIRRRRCGMADGRGDAPIVDVADLAKSYRTPNGRDRRAARPLADGGPRRDGGDRRRLRRRQEHAPARAGRPRSRRAAARCASPAPTSRR